jgi:hypothetical protein
MKSYLVTTAIVFTLITLAHLWEVIDRRQLLVSDGLVFGASAGLAFWGFRLLRTRV